MMEIDILTSHLGAGLLLGCFFICHLLRLLSQRMGDITKMPPYYRGFDAGNLLIVIATLGYIFQCSAALAQEPASVLDVPFSLITFYIPLALGVSINLVVAMIYWGWLFRKGID